MKRAQKLHVFASNYRFQVTAKERRTGIHLSLFTGLNFLIWALSQVAHLAANS